MKWLMALAVFVMALIASAGSTTNCFTFSELSTCTAQCVGEPEISDYNCHVVFCETADACSGGPTYPWTVKYRWRRTYLMDAQNPNSKCAGELAFPDSDTGSCCNCMGEAIEAP